VEEYYQARALVDYEHKIFLQALQHAKLVQLVMPLRGATRMTLVDAFIVSDLALTGTMKSFIRNDTDHAWLRSGFPLMALHRPSERGTGNDITISVDPSSRITLKELHRELEVLECKRWLDQGKSRPSDHPRPGYKWNEPWYLEQRNESLIGAPRWVVKGQQYGSELNWQDVLNVLWKLYNPARNVQVVQRGGDLGGKDHHPIYLCEPTQRQSKQFLAVKWSSGDTEQSLVLSPTMKRYLMASITRRGDARAEIGIEDLPPEVSFDFVALPGGFALVHADGAFLMDDWSSETLAISAYEKEFEDVVTRCDVLDEGMELVRELSEESVKKLDIKLNKLVDQRTRLMTTMLQTTSRAADFHAARFRELLEKRFGIGSQLDQLYRMEGELEAWLKRALEARRDRRWAWHGALISGSLAILVILGLAKQASERASDILEVWNDPHHVHRVFALTLERQIELCGVGLALLAGGAGGILAWIRMRRGQGEEGTTSEATVDHVIRSGLEG
jgi:hypothetical protein